MTEQISQRRSSKVPWILGILGFILLIPFVFSVVLAQAQKEGVEFSPDDFTTRRFQYAKIEWLDWTISGLDHTDITSQFQQSLVDDLWIKPRRNMNKTWHLVSDSITTGDSPDFDARILFDYLQMPIWSDWNDDQSNQKKAKVLWPAVATLARNYVYWAIPDLMDLAINQKSLSDQQFTQKVNQISADALLQNAKIQSADGKFQDAKKSIDAAINFQKTDEILAIQAEIDDKVGEADSGNSDGEEPDDNLEPKS